MLFYNNILLFYTYYFILHLLFTLFDNNILFFYTYIIGPQTLHTLRKIC